MNEVPRTRRHHSRGMQHDLAQFDETAVQIKEIADDCPKVRRPRYGDLRVVARHHRMCVMPGMAPAPEIGLAQAHERQKVIETLVQPAAAEGATMRAFVPMSIARGVERSIDEKCRNGPPG